MNFVTKQLIGTIGPAVMKSVIKSMLTEENLVEYRAKAINYIKGQAEKTSNEVDDGLVDMAVEWIMEPGNYIEYTKNLCQLAKGYVRHTATEYDNMLCRRSWIVSSNWAQDGNSQPRSPGCYRRGFFFKR